MSDEPLQSLGDDATSARSARRPVPSAVSLGDERTAGGGAGGTDTLVAGLEIVDLEARYTIERRLGQGGMGAVLLATDTRLGRKVAIKRILGTAAGNRIAVARFLTEARAIAAVSHPNIVQIYDYGRAQDGPFLIMEYVDGGSLLDRCGSSAIPLGEALELACRLCDGLAKAHDGGIIHRDIKPANILLASDGAPKLTDFGLAKAEAVSHGHTITGTGAVMGTPDFMPPEQRRDAAEVDHRSDLWSLAATVYQMVTGRSPRIIRLGDVPPALQCVLGKALEDRKDSRYQSAREFRDALETVRAAAGGGGGSAAAADAVEEGRCPACGILNPDKSRKFCRNPRCGASLRMACLQCDAQMPAWEAICGECGANQPRKLAEKRAAFEATRATAEERLTEHAFDAAAALADELAAISLPQLSDLAGWGRQFAERIAQERTRQEDFAAEKVREARAHGDAFDYPACILALEAIPQRLRTTAAVELLATFQKRHAEATRLIDTIAARIGRREIDGLVPLVERAVSLRGDRKDLAKLRDQLAQRLGRRLVAARTALAAGDAATARQALAGAAIEDLGEEAAFLDRVTRAAAAEERLLALVKEAKADGTVSVAEAREIVQAGEECLADNPASATAKLLVGQAREILESHARRLRQAEARRTRELERQKREEQSRREAVARQRAEILGRPPFRNSVGMQLKLLPAGAYTMGQAGYETPQRVSIVKPFFIPPVPVRQWVISVPKRLRGFLADRPEAVRALTQIFLAEIERLLCAAAGATPAAKTSAAGCPRLGAVSFLHRFGSALNRHVHLHACVTDGVFVPPADGAGCDAPPAFLPARPINPADLAAVTEKVRRRLIRWFRRTRLLDAEAAADMLAWEHSGFSIDASVRIALIDRDVPSYFKSLEHLLRYCARPPFALERLSVTRSADGQIARIRYVLPRHKAANWVRPSRSRKSTRPGASGVVDLTPFEFLDRLADLVPPPRKHRHRYHGVFAPNHPLRRAVTALAVGNVGKRQEAAAGRTACDGHGTGGCCDATHTHQKPRSHDTSRMAWAKLMARVGEEFPLACPTCGGDIRLIAFITEPGPIRKILAHLGEPLEPPPVSPARGPPADWGEVMQIHDDRAFFQASPDDLPVIDIHSL